MLNGNIRILCIEDTEGDFRLVERRILRDGLQTLMKRVETRDEIEAALSAEPWDVILTDYTLPSLRVEDEIPSIAARWPDLPIILVSGSIGEEKAADCLKAGVWDFVLKDGLARLVPAITKSLQEAQEKTRLRAAERDLRIAATAFEAQEAMVITDAEARIIRTNRAFSRLSGYSAEEVVGHTPRLLQSGQQPAEFYSSMKKELLTNSYWFGEVANRRKNGQIYPAWLAITAVRGENSGISHYVGILRDLTEEKKAADRIHQLAFFDVLTGLPNRRMLRERLKTALSVSRGSSRAGALVLLDLDNFRMINDAMGHDLGDRLLCEAATRLSLANPESDMVARIGGDEFAILFNSLADSRSETCLRMETITRKLQTVLRREYALGSMSLPVTSSMGVAVFDGLDNKPDTILNQADLAMVQAKSRGRDAVCFFDPAMQATVDARLGIEAELRRDVAQGNFVVHYQPRVDRSNRTVGFEGLVRWPHPERGLLPPASFIAVAEESDLITSIGRLVTARACDQLVHWQQRPGMADLSISVNVSARQFRSDTIVDEVKSLLRARSFPARNLTLELTESLLVADMEATLEKVLALRESGVRFSLDDFGTGYSSLSYLHRLPFDEVKIDRAFVADMLKNTASATLVKSIVAMGHSLGLSVTAEGVETVEQWDALREIGCDHAQGFLFGKAVPATMIAEGGALMATS